MALSRPVWVKPVEKAFRKMMEKLEHKEDMMHYIEQVFLSHYKKEKVNTEEFENVNLATYFDINLKYTVSQEPSTSEIPTYSGHYKVFNPELLVSTVVHALCKFRIRPEDYGSTFTRHESWGPVTLNYGEMREHHIKVWIEKLEKRFGFDICSSDVKRFDYRRVVRDYYELSVIVNRCLKEENETLKNDILENIIHRLHATEIFLLKEVCEAHKKYGGRDADHKNSEWLHDLTIFVISAEIMYRKLRKIVFFNMPRK
ncbi:hypothetical protein L5515_018469 [Caenorhabditis briggsae]|uniref:Uncharacterized protein n=1 Tax=Caenorhabditis briggsae TaxID=6238 RepID=A0AAE9FH62_CAEBR|nr:hypothetical protein L5515_018469 [Caenorhabditis briggsae]